MGMLPKPGRRCKRLLPSLLHSCSETYILEQRCSLRTSIRQYMMQYRATYLECELEAHPRVEMDSYHPHFHRQRSPARHHPRKDGC